MRYSNEVDYSSLDLSNPDDWIPLSKASERFENIEQKTFTYLAHHCNINGLSPILKHVGKPF